MEDFDAGRSDLRTGRMTNVAAEAAAGNGRDWWVMAGTSIAAVSAAVASFDGLSGLAHIAGWPDRLAWLFPVTLDAYAMTSARVWLAASTRTQSARRFARANAVGAIAASIAGNAAYHAHGAGLLAVSWPVVVLVGAVPAAVLGLTAHLHALRGRSEPDSNATGREESGSGPRRAPRTRGRAAMDAKSRRAGTVRRRPRRRTEAELLAAARVLDRRHRDEYGRSVTRDALRAELRISGARASALRRQLASADKPSPEIGTDEGGTA